MKQSTLCGLVVAVAFLGMPLSALAQEAAIVPDAIDFGVVDVGTSATEDITITSAIDDDLRIFAIVFLVGDNPTGAFQINVMDPIGDPMDQGTFVTIEVTFLPVAAGPHEATLTIVTNDGTNPIQTVPLSGVGFDAGDALDLLYEIIMTDYGIVGVGSGNSAEGRLRAFENMLFEAFALLAAGDVSGACVQLEDAYNRADGDDNPPDFVDGGFIDELLSDLETVMDLLECP